MVQRTPKGWEAREYFIKCEKELFQLLQNPTPNISTETSQGILDKLKNFENRLDTYSITLGKNLGILFKQTEDIYFKALEKAENFTIVLCEKLNKRVSLLENEISILKNQEKPNKNLKFKSIFAFLVVLDKETNYHKIFTIENPIFIQNNQKMYFETSEVLFFMEFEQKTECKKLEKYIFGLFKMQKKHIKEDYFELKEKHFEMLKILKVK
jgi:phage anti-repressor protein